MSNILPIIPHLPAENLMMKHPMTGEWDMHPVWKNFFDQLIFALQTNFSNQGVVVPQQPATNITAPIINNAGQVVYDNTNHLLKVNLNGVIKTITTS